MLGLTLPSYLICENNWCRVLLLAIIICFDYTVCRSSVKTELLAFELRNLSIAFSQISLPASLEEIISGSDFIRGTKSFVMQKQSGST